MIEMLPDDAVGLRLAKYFGDNLRLCEAVIFELGRQGVDMALRRAAISGRVDGGPILDHLADVMNANLDIVETIALDAKSFSALKNHWMPCKYEEPPHVI